MSNEGELVGDQLGIASGTALIYNGVILNDCETQSYHQEVIQDESQSDVMFLKYSVSVVSTVVGFLDENQQTNGIQIQVPISQSSRVVRGSVAEQMAAAHQKLSEKGKDFWFIIRDAPSDLVNTPANVLLIACGDTDSNLTNPLDPSDLTLGSIRRSEIADVNNGPNPTAVDIRQIYGGRTMRVAFSIEIFRKVCDPAGVAPDVPTVPGVTNAERNQKLIDSGSTVLSNRWSITESKDANWKTTRTLDGTLRVANLNVIALTRRYLVVPPLLRGYQRANQRFLVDQSGLTLKYTIEDKQRHEAPPRPAIDWRGTYVEAAAKIGAIQHSEIDLTLVGPDGVDKQRLIGAAGQVVAQRMRGVQRKPDDDAYSGILDGASIISVIGEPIIQMRVRFKRTKSQNSDKLGIRVRDMGKPLAGEREIPDAEDEEGTKQRENETAFAIAGYDHEVWPVPHYQDHPGNELIGVFTTYNQHPCSPYHNVIGAQTPTDSIVSSRPDVDDSETKTDQDIRVYETSKELTFDESAVSRDYQQNNPFTFVDITSEYITDYGVAHMPYAKADISNGDTTAIIPLHSGICQRVLRMEATRVGKPPVLPKSLDEFTDINGIREVRMDLRYGLKAPEFVFDELTQEYTAMVEYRYALSRPPTDTEKLRMATSPFDMV